MAIVRNLTRGTVVTTAAEVADGHWRRMRGLIGRRRLAHGAGMILPRVSWIHTAFMAFPVDIVFYDRGGHVLRTIEHMAPWRPSPICWRAHAVIELPPGAVQASRTRVGDVLRVE